MGAGTIQQRILDLLSEGGERTHAQILAVAGDDRPSSVSVTLSRMCHDGRLEQPRRGSYRVARAQPAARVATAADIRAVVLALRPGQAFDARTVIRAAGTTYINVHNALAGLLSSGAVARSARGLYVRSGAPERMGGTPLPRYVEVSRMMAASDRVWSTAEVQAALAAPLKRTDAAHVLNNMLRSGYLDRVAPGRWLLTDMARQRVRAAAPRDAREDVAGLMRGGGLWRAVDLCQALGLNKLSAGLVLRDLEGSGEAVYVVGGHWRATGVAADLASEGRSQAARFVGMILAVAGADFTTEDFELSHGSPIKGYTGRFHRLVQEGIVEPVGYGRRRLAPGWAPALASRLTPSPAPRPALTPLGRRLVDALRDEGPVRKVDVAAKVGTNRGVSIRMVDRLVGEGRMLEVSDGLYMVG